MVTIVFWLLLIFSPLLLGQGFKWLIVPLLAFRKYFSPAKPAFRPTALEDLTPEMRQFIGSRIQEFAHEGFEVVANVSIGSSPQTQTFTVLLVNRETNDKAYASGAISQSVRNLEYAVVSEFDGDRAVLTGMNMTVNPYPRRPGHDACMFSWELDAPTLCEFHRRRLRRRGLECSPRQSLPPGTELDSILASDRNVHEWNVKCGYEKYVQRRDGYVATLKGIYLVMWRLMEPLKARRFKRREREAMAEWHALGMEEFVAASQPVNPAEHAPASLRPGNEPATGALGYEVSLAKDEVRFERSPGKLIVRGGSATFAQFLLESWPQWLTLLMWAGFSAIALTLVARVAFMPPNPRMRFPWSFLFYACVTVIFFGQALFGLYMTLQRRRRPVIIEASESGLSFRSTTTSTKPGSIPRSHIQAINVMVTNTRGFRRVYGMKVHPMAGNPLVLIESRDEEVLKKVQKEISLAMGLEAPDAAADIVAGKSA